MAVIGARVEAVKSALRDSEASQDTAAALQALLGLETASVSSAKTSHPEATQTIATSTKQRLPTKTFRPTGPRTKKPQPVAFAEDVPRTLSPRERYALATETVNFGLKTLNEAVKSLPKRTECFQNGCPPSPPSASRKALQPRSNNITPGPSPEKLMTKRKPGIDSPPRASREPGSHVTATAECTRMAFAFLRSVDTQKLGVREIPRLQLETGMLALVGKLIPLGLETMAVKELRHVKRRIESMFAGKKDSKPAGAKSRTTANQPDRETLASLLHLSVNLGSESESLNLAATYCMHVLRIIAQKRKPAVIEETAQYLEMSCVNSPADLLCRLAKAGESASKCAKQLDALSQIITSLCPSPSSSSDEVAIESSHSPAPEAVIKLQATALKARKLWWPLAGHRADIDKDLLEPFLRCAVAFLRRSADSLSRTTIYEQLAAAWRSLGPIDWREDTSIALFNIHSLLSQHAEQAENSKEALSWSTAMLDDCKHLEHNHARLVSATVRHTILSLDTPEDVTTDLKVISEALESKLAGTAADFDGLLAALHRLSKAPLRNGSLECLSGITHKTLALAASFALRYHRSYPHRGTTHAIAIINATLRASSSSDDLLSWVNPEAAMVFIQADTLKKVASVASRRSLSEAWEVSVDAISLSRISRALLLSKLRSQGKTSLNCIFDNDSHPAEERGALLELQLRSVIQLSSKSKYHVVMRQIISDLLRGLAEVYTSHVYPLRRARVAIAVLRLHATCDDLLSADVLAEWRDSINLDLKQLGKDDDLRPYFEDLNAALSVSRAFENGSPDFDQLKAALVSSSQLVDGCTSSICLRDRIDDPAALVQQLRVVATYLSTQGLEQLRLPVLSLLDRIEKLRGNAVSASYVDLIRCYLELGYSGRAGEVLAQVAAASLPGLQALQYQLIRSEYLLAIDDHEACDCALSECRTQRQHLSANAVSRDQRHTYELLHAQGWLAHSQYTMKYGSPHEALAGAKRSVKILNSMWATLEREVYGKSSAIEEEAGDVEEPDSSVKNLAKGISKLQLTPESETSRGKKSRMEKGASFWPLMPTLTKALLHLSDMYIWHGLFAEANYYSERAVSIAESVGSGILLSRVRSHRVQIMSLAGRLEEAELCLTQDESTELQSPSLARLERLCAEAALRTKEGSLEEAVERLSHAQSIIDELSSEDHLKHIECLSYDVDALADKATALSLSDTQSLVPPQKASKALPKKTAIRSKTARAVPKKAQPASQPVDEMTTPCYPLGKIKIDIMLQETIVRLKMGQDVENVLSKLASSANSISWPTRMRVAEHLSSMAQANAALEMDVTMNVLVESTLSIPSFTQSHHLESADDALSGQRSSATMKATARSRPPPKSKSKAGGPSGQIVTMLQKARDCLLQDTAGSPRSCSTAQSHLEYSMLANASMLLSAISHGQNVTPAEAAHQSLSIDQPRMKGVQYESQAVHADRIIADASDPLCWPSVDDTFSTNALTTTRFKEEYIDILPEPWTAVSLCLNEDASELYIARYRSHQQPLVLRLPFSRHKPDDSDEEAFDYAKGKTELHEIIDLSNYTCHSSRNMDAKGAKTTWWSDREALDRRMQELLINMESIWFGGFKSVFSQQQLDEELLPRFRRSFEEILDRHLPSRQAARGKRQHLTFDDKVLDLFIGLGHDQDGIVDLDEPLADLLYFVVDLLQFRGERNAYDEIDFDSMAVDVLDALRAYHEGLEEQMDGDRHLILVLDRRLQAFPWENMPCLQGESVSRVGSMESLRNCITAMRFPDSEKAGQLPNEGDGCHVVKRTSGTYILNPSSDLKATQTMLAPALSSLTTSSGQPWRSVVNSEPDEQRFAAALQDSSLLLYFGHGAGSQYIRPRHIKRLEQCSEVVWLMGCSSGAVTEHGELEPTAVPHAYLLAGGGCRKDSCASANADGGWQGGKCLAVLATLWDVTDKDIDRFSLRVGEEWGLWPRAPSSASQLAAKTPKKRNARQVVPPATPQQVPKTPKTPKVRKTPAAAGTKTPGRRGGSAEREESGDGKKRSLVQAVGRGREACYLRYLNGAAAVVYGVPVYLGD